MNISNAASQLMQLGRAPKIGAPGTGGNIPNAGLLQARQYANQAPPQQAPLPAWLQQLMMARQGLPNQPQGNQPVTQGLGAGSAFPGTPPNATDA